MERGTWRSVITFGGQGIGNETVCGLRVSKPLQETGSLIHSRWAFATHKQTGWSTFLFSRCFELLNSYADIRIILLLDASVGDGFHLQVHCHFCMTSKAGVLAGYVQCSFDSIMYGDSTMWRCDFNELTKNARLKFAFWSLFLYRNCKVAVNLHLAGRVLARVLVIMTAHVDGGNNLPTRL